MLNIILTYTLDGLTIAEFLEKEVHSNHNWKIEQLPILGKKEKTLFERQINDRTTADVILFIGTESFYTETVDILQNIDKDFKHSKCRMVWVNINNDKSIFKNNNIFDNEFFLFQKNGTKKIEGHTAIINYLKSVEVVTTKVKRITERKKNFYLYFIIIYIAVLFGGSVLLFLSESSIYKSSAQILLLVELYLGSLTVFLSIVLFVINRKHKIEREERKEFDRELNHSLSKNFSSEDDELSHAIGDNDYLPLGHLKLNWKQMKGYYDISKKQAQNSFRLAIVICFFGILIIVFAILSPIFPAFSGENSLIPLIGSIGGTVVELFAGTILIVYKKSLTQMNLYHKALSEYQRYLSCINLVSMIATPERQEQLYEEIIHEEIKKVDIFDDDEIKSIKSIIQNKK